jgi:putative peptide zinc metalloprotease protein
MAQLAPQADRLPTLRPDVELRRGTDDADGAPTFLLHDPLRGTFDKLSWAQAEIVRRLRRPTTLTQLLGELMTDSTVRAKPNEVQQLCQDVHRHGLTQDTRWMPPAALEQAAALKHRAAGLRAFAKLLYCRIPLLQPDTFLDHTVHWVRWLGSPFLRLVYLCVGVLAAMLLTQHWDAYIATLPRFFNAAGIVAFVLAIAAIKTVHEFSHAYVAKAHDTRVPSMGIALILMLPVAFADVTDSWRLRSRRQRLWISAAGVTAELVIAAFAVVGWALSPPGLLQSVCFILSSTTIVSTLVVNLNPAMRYDGYYVLSDLLAIDNLQTRAFAAIRWAFHRFLLGLHEAPPEPRLRGQLLATLLTYAVGAWLYRLVLYSAIALMLYHRFTKVVGIALFIGVAFTLFVRPIAAETVSLWQRRRTWRPNWRGGLTGLVLLALLTWLAWPLPRHTAIPATTVAAQQQVLYAPGPVCWDRSVCHEMRTSSGDRRFL